MQIGRADVNGSVVTGIAEGAVLIISMIGS